MRYNGSMSMAIGHFAVGVTATTVMYHVLPFRARAKMRVAQVSIVILGGLWGMLPDVAKLADYFRHFNDKYWTRLAILQETGFSDLSGVISHIEAFHDSRWADICFLHRVMDTVDKNDRPLVSAMLVLAMVLVVAYVFLRELTERRRHRR